MAKNNVYQVLGTELAVSGSGRRWRVRRAIGLGMVTHEIFPTKREAVAWALLPVNRNRPALT